MSAKTIEEVLSAEYKALWDKLVEIDLHYSLIAPFDLEALGVAITESGVEDSVEGEDGEIGGEPKVYPFHKVPHAFIHDLSCLVTELSDYLNEARGILNALARMAEVRDGGVK